MEVSYSMVMSFYVVVVGLCMMLGAYIARSVKFIFELAGEVTGVIVGALVGIFVSQWLWFNYGRQMVA